MKVTFLGTGTSQGVPVIGCSCVVCRSLDYRDKRLRTSIHVEINGQSWVIDTGPDFRQQMLRENITRLDAVILTHAHRDHTSGIDDVRAYNFLQNMNMPVFGTTETLNQIKSDFSYIFGPDNYPGLPRLDLRPITDSSFELNGIPVTPLPVMHLHLPVLGFRIGNFSYITDANAIHESTFKKLKGTQTLVINALQREQHISHFNLQEAIEVVKKINPEKAYFTHISHKMGLHAEVSKELPKGIELAMDGLKLTIQS
ncbi:MAG TPA: MBL fold metallo-hydrolase [Cyclobacteriaceae bacterium]|nr:MBL fold metallo-hydrolase [Cyclobacteriaceae bacterium]